MEPPKENRSSGFRMGVKQPKGFRGRQELHGCKPNNLRIAIEEEAFLAEHGFTGVQVDGMGTSGEPAYVSGIKEATGSNHDEEYQSENKAKMKKQELKLVSNYFFFALCCLDKNGKQITEKVSYCAHHRAPNPDTVLIIHTPQGEEKDLELFSTFRERLYPLQSTEKSRVCFGRSGIHGWGLFARRNIQEEEMVSLSFIEILNTRLK
ncbi:hypothetical protein OPV22_013610 [Ensete ventricosum]|uniref:Uncharacterized protein n=1 Tax=Ensete ventricosum TaxID=4639 RepID=A0AAV8PIF5_ENSVE|nr:hypothetical protein OPV22_013610 [Ensete ventricosum]